MQHLHDTTKLVGEGAFSENSALTDVYYLGAAEEWNAISIGDNNAPLASAARHCVLDMGYHFNGGNFTWILDRDGTLTVNGSGNMPNFVITYGSPPWNDRSDDIRALKLSEGITSVGTYSFRYCYNLEEVTFPDSLTDIGQRAFYATGLKSVRLPASLTSIGYYAFYYNSSLSDVYYDGTSTDWGNVSIQDGNSPLTGATIHCLKAVVRFDPAGGTLSRSEYTAVVGEPYGELPTPERGEEYQFLGWYTDPDYEYGTQVTQSDVITEDIILYAHWKYLVVRVEFEPNGIGASVDVNGVWYVYYTTLRIIGKTYGYKYYGDEFPDANRENGNRYRFLGWYTAQSDGTQVTKDDIVTQAITLYAHWQELCTVCFDANGGTVSPSEREAAIGEPYGELPTPERGDKFEFLGWYTENGTPVTPSDAVTGDVTLYAHWKMQEILLTVDFNYNGGEGSVNFKEVTSGKIYGTLPEAIKAGYVFDYWYWNDAEGNEIPVTSGSTVEQTVNHILYAHYSQPEVAVRFALNGGGGKGMEKRIYTYWDLYGPLPKELSWERHSFVGWFTEAEGGIEITSTTHVKQPEATRNTQGEWAVLLYAHWVDDPKVTLDPTGGLMDECKKEVKYGEPFGDFLEDYVPKLEAYQFRGWYTGKLNGKRVDSASLVESYGDFTLYAHWRPVHQTITFNPNGLGSVEEPTKIVENGRYYDALPSLITPDGANYVLDGWYTKPGDEDKGDRIYYYTPVDLDEKQTLYAHVKPKDKFTVRFDLNGVEATVAPESISVEYGKTYGDGAPSGTLPVPTGADREFLGWYTSEQAGQRVLADTLVQLGNHQTLYAHWGANPNGEFTVKLVPDDGATVEPDTLTVKNGEPYGVMPTPKKEGYSFLGWYTEKTAGTLVSSASKFQLKENQTLYAHWKEARDFRPERDGYHFDNSVDAFKYESRGPGEDYPISYSVFKLIFGDTVAGKMKYRSMIQGTWGGNCNGMASTAGLLFAGGYITPEDFGKDFTFLLDITDRSDKIAPVSDVGLATVKTFIEAMQAAQYTEPFSKDYKQNRVYQSQLDGGGSLNALFDAVEGACQNGRGTIIGVGNSYQRSAHALLAYKTEESAGALRIYVYDCNYPGQVRYIQLSRNAQGLIKDWSYEIGGNFGVWASGAKSGCYISYIPYETIEYIWANRGHLYDNHVMLTVNSENLSIVTGFGKEKAEVAKLVDGRLETANDDIYDIPELSLTLTGTPSDRRASISLYLPADEYTLISEDDGTPDGELQASLVDYNLCATVSTTASEVTFDVEDISLTNSVTIGAASEKDKFSVSLENGYEWAPTNTFAASGKGAGENITVQVGAGNQFTLKGTSNLDSLLVNDVPATLSDFDGPSELFSDVVLDKSSGVLSFTLNNPEGGTLMALAYDEANDAEFVGTSMKDVAAGAGRVELKFADTKFPEACKIKLMLLKEWPSWRVLGSYEEVK